MVKKEGSVPVNARIDVDYSGKKPKIKFGYTEKDLKKQAIEQNSYGKHTFILLILTAFIITGIYFKDIGFYKYEAHPQNCFNISYDEYHYVSNYSDYTYDAVYGFNLSCDNSTYIFDFRTSSIRMEQEPTGFYRKPDSDEVIKDGLIIIGWFVAWVTLFIISNKIVTRYLIKQRWYQKWLPVNQAKGKWKKYKKFTAKDIENNMVLIPNFGNVFLDYKTKGDFSKHLKKIKIREHRYNKYNTKKKKIGKLRIKNFDWHAIFIFKDKPKNGYLEVIYK